MSDYYRVFAADVIRRDTKSLCSKDAFFKNGYKEVKGAKTIETYFLATTEAVVSCTFDIADVRTHRGNCYFRWVMKLTIKGDRWGLPGWRSIMPSRRVTRPKSEPAAQ